MARDDESYSSLRVGAGNVVVLSACMFRKLSNSRLFAGIRSVHDSATLR